MTGDSTTEDSTTEDSTTEDSTTGELGGVSRDVQLHGAQVQTTLSLELPSNVPAPLIQLPSPPCDLESYTITRLHAEGGTARIYRAFESHSKRPIAIKLLRRRFHSDEVISQLFSRHHRALASLRLPHFANTIDNGTSIWGPWSAIEWVPGRNLKALIEEGVHWNSPRLFRLLLQLCEALEALHERGVVHGDLSAHNIIFSEGTANRSSEQFTLIDIALPLRLNLADDADQLARSNEVTDRSMRAQRRLSNETSVFGQPVYLAPECLRGHPPSVSSDLYSLGVLFFELTTGTLPFNGSLTQVIHAVLHQNAPAPSIHQNPWPYPVALDALISNLLSKHPADRCTSVKQVQSLLLNMSKGYPSGVEVETGELHLDRGELDKEESQRGGGQREEDKLLDTQPLSLQELKNAILESPEAEEIRRGDDEFMSDLEEDTDELKDGASSDTPTQSTGRASHEAQAAQGYMHERVQYGLYTPTPTRLRGASSARRAPLSPPSRPTWITNLIWLLLGMISSWITLTIWSQL